MSTPLSSTNTPEPAVTGNMQTKPSAPDRLHNLVFDNSYTRELPGDPITANYRRQVTDACWSRVRPDPTPDPILVAHSPETASLLGLPPAACADQLFLHIFSGNRLLPDMEPFAMCYGGHQFGNWAGQLGDGRAINLGEVVTKERLRWTLQLKGAGATPYSRNADGMAVLRSSLREFLCSEAMHHLGIPTTRALSLIITGETVERDMFYDGRIKEEPGAVVCRVASAFIRFGNFEIHTARNEIDTLILLADYTLKTYFPHLGSPSSQTYVDLFGEVCSLTLDMIVHWMRVGFVHGVMNTDNMSILGQTIDYGPYGWLEGYQPDWTPNTTDRGKRYCYGNQPLVAQWNLAQLANALYPLVNDVEGFKQHLERFTTEYQQRYLEMMGAKIGLASVDPTVDTTLIHTLEELLQVTETDMTIFFRELANVEIDQTDKDTSLFPETSPLYKAYYAPEEMTADHLHFIQSWLDAYRKRIKALGISDIDRRIAMNRINPKYVLRNYLAQLAIDAAEQSDYSTTRELLHVLRNPYSEQPGMEKYAEKRPEWARHRPGCSMLSCSS